MTQRSALAYLTAVPLSGWADPAVLFSAGEALERHAFFLDAGPDAHTGWSYLGAAEPSSAEQALDVDLTGSVETAWPAGPFRGGWIVALDYDGAAGRTGAPATISTAPLALTAMRFLAFDHAARSIWAVSPQQFAESFARESQLRIDEASGFGVVVPILPEALTKALSRHTATEYADAIAQCREAIREGDAYQLCMTTRFTVTGRHDAAAVFMRLRAATASHHGAFLRFGDVAIVSASPEQFLTVSAGRVQTKPIKGTRPRGTTPEHDAQLAAELLASEKERAENVMIVDLMRNDLSRTCVVGSVRVDKLWHVESYPAVHQLVSTVSGELKTGTTLRELVDTTFPAGSMTGAPKLSAMTILHGLERGSRGFYAGCFGWVSQDGSVDLAMTIRTIVVSNDEAYVGAGGGITWLSNVQEEVQEVAIKAKAPLAALGARVQAAWLQPR